MLGERVWFWRDAASQGLLNKIRWLGPAHVVMREEHTPSGSDKPQVKTYWLAYKTQLIRAAPHHVRSDILGPEHVIHDLQKSLNMVRQLKSRGVTRWYDLSRVNRQRLDDVDDDDDDDDDEQVDDPNGSLDEGTALPPARRLRLHPPEHEEPDEPLVVDAEEYSPTSPPHSGFAPTSPTGLMAPPLLEQEGTELPPPVITTTSAAHIPVPLSLPASPAPRRSRSQPPSPSLAEPGAEPTAPTPHAPQATPSLDPATAALYEPVDAESFQERRNRFNRQETLSFGPWRHRSSSRRSI